MNENELTGLLESLRRMGSDDLNVEVKESATTLSRDVWETVSAFANTAGGIIVLGVSERALSRLRTLRPRRCSTNS